MGKRTRYTYVTVGPVICLQSRPFLGKSYAKPSSLRLTQTSWWWYFWFSTYPHCETLFNWLITRQNKKKRCSPDRKVHQLLRIPFFHFNLLDNFAWECVSRPIEQRLSTLLGNCLNKNPSLTNPGKGETTTCKDDVKENFTGRTNGTWSFCYIHLGIQKNVFKFTVSQSYS